MYLVKGKQVKNKFYCHFVLKWTAKCKRNNNIPHFSRDRNRVCYENFLIRSLVRERLYL